MSFIKRRRKRMYYIVLAIGVIAGSVLGITLSCLFGLRREQIRQKESKENSVSVIFLKKEKQPGEEIRDSDIEIRELSKEVFPDYAMQKSYVVGKQAKSPLAAGMVLYENMVYVEEIENLYMRRHSYSYIKQMDTLKKGDIIDVRISFPNGADFIVLSKKTVLDVTGGETQGRDVERRLWLYVNEEEILRMSSCVVDAYINEGAYLYAVTYVNDMQDAAVVNYPVNEVVENLIKKDPNIIKIAQEQKTLELRSLIDGISVMRNESNEDNEGDKGETEHKALEYYE